MSTPMQLTLKNDLAEIERLNQAVEDFGREHGLSPEVVFAVRLSLEEVVTDILSYAHEDEDEHLVDVRVRVHPERKIVVTVEDDGKPFDPLREIPAPNLYGSLDERPVGGLGFHLVKGHMDSLEYQRRDGKNLLTMAKHL
ncbi:MAG: hypothetical protein AUJ92_17545 [Armatimonadetes bacterium CG2_30_59_28]|nr:ATP-binding protein [Armatimonadota bacterium]OIO90935.1 MAG: hypothetical protein AUJ92_17545 [Armatimonadetes bacterium CG2_30_59_28]PIU66933.1 MAG: ATP-binding protein [Armatimonadetes bacterium CG07_land_8_20_14_0_80_59_28]PIX40114.1 MAG: ATP-binding protein [Armatimonadetes bacterium CG_4_8_14_3_um_filter_58_9]PIY38702.1 MAG: ATP-binding protein [Armatimonadetes bacterium CG_4_10_14_3_um_filter_59_10]PJB75958.1 MAG: ATP-binding protein [Armatimonadetes bacterium CG_4_9_14_3_um_filter_5